MAKERTWGITPVPERLRTLSGLDVGLLWGNLGISLLVLVVCHEIPLRYALNAAAGSESLDGPAHEIGNALPFLFDAEALERAVAGIERIAGRVSA